MRKRAPFASSSDVDDQDLSGASAPGAAKEPSQLSPSEYTDWAIKQEIERDIKIFPSVDPIIQQEISRKYRILHEKVREGGFYECPYLDYGKEMARYSILFTVSMVALRHEWYMTSAIFLGLFWVSFVFGLCSPGMQY